MLIFLKLLDRKRDQLRRVWQASLIALARSKRVKQLVQDRRAGSQLASRYVAGPSANDAIDLAQELRKQNFLISAFYLGEYVDRPELVRQNVDQKLAVVEALARSGLDVHVSVDPTQIGFQQSPKLARENALHISSEIARASNNRPGVHCLMLDMEDDSIVDVTLALHDELRAARLPVAITVQAYLRRTAGDLERKLRQGAHVRLVKGAYELRRGRAFDNHRQVKENYRQLVRRMLSRDARDAGLYPSIATHDTDIHELVLDLADRNGWKLDEFEFEMLLGVRPGAATSLVARGARVRIYVPFGQDWWPHAARRIGESPRNAWLLLGSALRSQARTI